MGIQANFLASAFAQSLTDAKNINHNRDDIIEIALRGGFPEVIDSSTKDRNSWHRDYIEAILERDLKDIVNIRRQDAMKNLVQVVAAWSTKFIDIEKIGAGLSIKRPTIETYLNALEKLYLVEKIEPWTRTDYERINKHSKLLLVDSGLMASILRWQIDDIRFDNDRLGKLIETHVAGELQKHISSSETDYHLYHYRDREKHEIDFIIEADNGDILGIEVKASTSVGKSDFKHLKWFKDNLAPKNKQFIGIVLYCGEHIASFGHGLWAAPISLLYAS